MPDSFFSNLPLPCLQLSTKYFPDNDTAKLDMDACTVTCRFGPLTLWQTYRKLWNISRAHRLSKESRERNVEKEAETKGMTGLSALLAADFDLGMRPGPDASSCYVCVSVCVVQTLAIMCVCDPILTHTSCVIWQINIHVSDSLLSAADYIWHTQASQEECQMVTRIVRCVCV